MSLRYALIGHWGQDNKHEKIISHILDDHFVHHKFGRSVNIPAGINKATFQWEMDNDGHVCITAQSESAAEPRRISIKIKEGDQPKK
jgi:hypothetical protein